MGLIANHITEPLNFCNRAVDLAIGNVILEADVELTSTLPFFRMDLLRLVLGILQAWSWKLVSPIG